MQLWSSISVIIGCYLNSNTTTEFLGSVIFVLNKLVMDRNWNKGVSAHQNEFGIDRKLVG